MFVTELFQSNTKPQGAPAPTAQGINAGVANKPYGQSNVQAANQQAAAAQAAQQAVPVTGMANIAGKFKDQIANLAKFYGQLKVWWDDAKKAWFTSTPNAETFQSFLRDANGMFGVGGKAVTEDGSPQHKLVAILRRYDPETQESKKVYVYREADSNVFDIEINGKEKTVRGVSLAIIKQHFEKHGFNESVENDEVTEARSVKMGNLPTESDYRSDYPVPKKMNKGVDKLYAKVMDRQVAREMGKPSPYDKDPIDVAIVVDEYPDMLAYGNFRRVGRNGLFHIKLDGGELQGWAAGDEIAVRPHEVYAVWDSSLQGKTVVHRKSNLRT